RRFRSGIASRNHSMKTRVGVVGTGYLGRLHARVLTEMPEAEVVGFVDVSDDTAREISDSLHLRRFESIAALAQEVDCAVVATPTTTHFAVANELIESGRDVMVEKPVTAEVEEGKRLVELAQKHNRILQVGHVERYNPAIVAAVPLLR